MGEVTREDRRAAASLIRISWPGNGAVAAWIEHGDPSHPLHPAAVEVAELRAAARAQGEDQAAKRILDFAKKLNFGPTLRTFIKKVSRGEHLEG